jgi:rubrerythrin
MALRGTQTEKNIMAAFAGESQARNRYTFFASQARKDSSMEIADTFAVLADQEKEHAKRLFQFLEGGEVEVKGVFPAGVIGATRDNLQAAISGEVPEHTEMYPSFAATARKEGFHDIAAVFVGLAAAEREHERRLRAMLSHVEGGTVFKKARPVVWRCRNCGYTTNGLEAPGKCPACAHPQPYFEALE